MRGRIILVQARCTSAARAGSSSARSPETVTTRSPFSRRRWKIPSRLFHRHDIGQRHIDARRRPASGCGPENPPSVHLPAVPPGSWPSAGLRERSPPRSRPAGRAGRGPGRRSSSPAPAPAGSGSEPALPCHRQAYPPAPKLRGSRQSPPSAPRPRPSACRRPPRKDRPKGHRPPGPKRPPRKLSSSSSGCGATSSSRAATKAEVG